eukprot:195543-Chlamydomonas_euryale.AAC.2
MSYIHNVLPVKGIALMSTGVRMFDPLHCLSWPWRDSAWVLAALRPGAMHLVQRAVRAAQGQSAAAKPGRMPHTPRLGALPAPPTLASAD